MDESPASAGLSPLPPVLSQGLVAVSFFGFLSCILSTSLFIFLTFRFLQWRRAAAADSSMNQFLVLIYNLVIADIQQAFAFLLNVQALRHNALQVGTRTCWAQGWFVSTGDLASSCFIFAIAVHTFVSVVKGRKIPSYLFYTGIACLWTFNYAMGIAGALMHPADLYVRAGAWCWININYQTERLWLHYFWVFVAMFGTIILYGTTYATLRARSSTTPIPHGATPLMLLYPTIYTVCTIPLAGGRIASMAGQEISLAYFCVAGSMIACNGWLDALLYSLTRRGIVFSELPSNDAYGIDTFWGLDRHAGLGTTTIIEAGCQSPPPKAPPKVTPKAPGILVRRESKTRRSAGRVSNSDSTENLYAMGRLGLGASAEVRSKGSSNAIIEIKTETTVHVRREVDTISSTHLSVAERQQAAESREHVDKASWETRSGRSFDEL